ncbi:MAG: DUF1015 family protein [Actinobacteria bacterium]|nr:DUF1015 family protein [Actinomycetota bacterium]
MATLDPTQGWLVTPAAAPRVIAPAYDSLSPGERARTADANPDSFLNVTRSPEDQVPGREIDHDTLLRTARATLERLLREGAFRPQPRPGYRILRMRLGEHVQTGVVGTVPVGEIGSVVRLHEETRADKEDDLVRHLEVVGVSSSPVGLVHRGPSPVADIVEGVTAGAPELVATSDDGLEQRVWTVDDPDDVAAVRGSFASVPALYLTDGHHRAAAAVRHARSHGSATDGPGSRLLVVAFPAGELRLEPYHRAVRGVGRDRAGEVLAAIRERFEVEPVPEGAAPTPPSETGDFALHLDGRWFTVRTSPDAEAVDPVAALAATVLQERILGPVLGIADARSDDRLEFVPGPRGLAELVRRAGADGAAFALPPTRVSELMAVADAGAVMPPKSTWFEPKVRSGMFLHPVTAGWDGHGLVG